MGILVNILTVLFVILCVLLIILILLQSDKSAGMGILGGSSQSTFGSSTADVITKISGVMIALYMMGSLGLSILEADRSTSIDKKVMTIEDKVPSGLIEKEKPEDTGKDKTSPDTKPNIKTKPDSDKK